MRKLTAGVALALAGALALAACGTPDDSGNTPASTGDSTTTTDGGAAASDYKACMVSDSGGFDDKSFNQSGYEGLQKAVQELGIQQAKAESSAESDFGPNVTALVAQNCNIIVTVGFLLNDATIEGATANPDTDFAIIDQVPSDADFNPVVLPNLKALVFNTQEASYLAGYLAAGMSKTGTVATYGGMKIPSVSIFMDGFVDGVAKYNEVHGTTVKALGWDKAAQDGTFTGDFEDQAKGKTYTQNFIDQGADIILPVAGPVGAGTLAAAKDAGNVSVIWVDADGFVTNPDFGSVILSSVVKEIGAAVFDTIEASSTGGFDNANYVGTLENGGVALAPFHDFADKVPAELSAEIDGLKADIIAGTIKVESPSAFDVK